MARILGEDGPVHVHGVEHAEPVVEEVPPRPLDVIVAHQLGHEVGPRPHGERRPRLAALEQLRVVADLPELHHEVHQARREVRALALGSEALRDDSNN